jgi:hypothetical protein
MATIRASCYGCGDVELPSIDFVYVHIHERGDGEYEFQCPKCSCKVRQPINARGVDRLLATGAPCSQTDDAAVMEAALVDLDGVKYFSDIAVYWESTN